MLKAISFTEYMNITGFRKKRTQMKLEIVQEINHTKIMEAHQNISLLLKVKSPRV